MTRYFVLVEGSEGTDPYIVAEVVREDDQDLFARIDSLAGNIAGESSSIQTRLELDGIPVNREALRLWDERNDQTFEADSARIDAAMDVAEASRNAKAKPAVR